MQGEFVGGLIGAGSGFQLSILGEVGPWSPLTAVVGEALGSPVMEGTSVRRSWGGGFALFDWEPAERWDMGPEMTPSPVAMVSLRPREISSYCPRPGWGRDRGKQGWEGGGSCL